jgi:potassium uptake Trk family protein
LTDERLAAIPHRLVRALSTPFRRHIPPRVHRFFVRLSLLLPPLDFITLHYAYFLGVCMVSSVIFWGVSTPARSVTYTDSLFCVVSAMTLAGLNTVNLSTFNVFQQIILFCLIISGSAIAISILVVHVRRKAFERHFQSTLEEGERRSRRDRSSHRRSLSFRNPLASLSRPSVQRHEGGDDIEAIGASSEPNQTISLDTVGSIEKTSQFAKDSEGNIINPVLDEKGVAVEKANITATSNPVSRQVPDHVAFSDDAGHGPDSPATQISRHHHILEMQGTGATTSHLSLRKINGRSPYPAAKSSDSVDSIPDELARDGSSPSRWLYLGFSKNTIIRRNSQFPNLTPAEREKLGGAEYMAVNFLSALVPLYFILWQLLGTLGLGACVATYYSEATLTNGLNPWWVGSFVAISAFNNSGMSLLDANMIPFHRSPYILLTTGILILAGNTCYPIFLRLIIWTLHGIAPKSWDTWRKTLRFLLDHPRRCYTNLFPARHTWWLLLSVVILNSIDWIGYELLNIGNAAVESSPTHTRILDGLFQALAVRSGGFYIIAVTKLRIGLQILYVLMMYISVYPVSISMRNSNVYEERSLGIYAEDLPQRSPTAQTESGGLLGGLKRRFLSRDAQEQETGVYFFRQQLRMQLAHDLWWIMLAILIITTIETGKFESDPKTYSVFNVAFEVVSGYGCVGISTGLPDEAYSFCGGWHKASKLVLCAVMIRGRHRGLPVAIDHAVVLPGERDVDRPFDEDHNTHLERCRSSRHGVTEA